MATWAAVMLAVVAASGGERAVVPAELQVELLAKVLAYDRNFAANAGPRVSVLVAYVPDNPESERVARATLSALRAQPLLGGLPHDEALVAYEGADALAEHAKDQRCSVVIVSTGLANQAPALASAFSGTSTLTVSVTAEGVREGVVLGFDLVSGRPRMLFNLAQSRRQHASFKAEVLQLMTVFP